MYTISDIIKDIDRGCMVHNMSENKFTYRVVFFANDRNRSSKNYIDTTYSELRKTLENIIKNNLTLTNSVVVSQITVRKNGKCVCLLSRSYGFSLGEYFRKLNGEYKNGNNFGNTIYRKKVSNWC